MSTSPEPVPSLSETDRELLLAALEHGYFDDPPQTSVEELAATHDLSERAAKRRLTRGLSALLQQYRSTADNSLSNGLVEEAIPWAP